MFKNIKNFFDQTKQKTSDNTEYLDEDIYAILSLLIEACKIDGDIDTSEIELIKDILVNKFHLEKSKAKMAIEFVLHKSTDKVDIYSDIKVIMDIMDHKERISVIEMLWSLILVDGKIDEFEANLMRRVCGLLHITGIESSEAKKRASISNKLI